MINPNDIAEKTFEKATFGYKSEDVDEYLLALSKAFADVVSQNQESEAKIIKLVEKINELTAEKTEIENSIKSAMGDCEKARCDGYRVSWAASQRRTFDSKKFVKENPNVDVEPYYKTSEVRTFRITADK